jgi:hypothetical protein
MKMTKVFNVTPEMSQWFAAHLTTQELMDTHVKSGHPRVERAGGITE